MLLLHISDIHFNRDFVSNPSRDPDAPIRQQLIRHAREYVHLAGPVDAILFTGDIAYRGAPEEYIAAKLWLKELAKAVQCDPSRILMVPGNHDVDQNIIKSNTPTHNAQLAIHQSEDQIDSVFQRQVQNEQSTADLLAPLAAYNSFALEFDCDLKFDRLTWSRDLAIDAHTTLRLHGLTSCLISGVDASIDRTPGRQYMNRTQIVLVPDDNIVHGTLCHHPPNWFRNSGEINTLLGTSARLQLFGHIHEQQIEQHGQNVRILAGATVPEYSHGESQPAYNFVRLSVSPQNFRQLDVAINQFEWQKSPPIFRSKVTPFGTEVFQYSVPIDRAPGASLLTQVQQAPVPANVAVSPEMVTAAEAPPPVINESPDWRQTIDAFFALPSSVRREIAIQLDVLEESEFQMNEKHRECVILTRIGTRSLQKEFTDLVFSK